MIPWTDNDRRFAIHTVEVMGDRLRCNDGYTEQDEDALDKLSRLGNGPKNSGVALLLTGDELSGLEAYDLYKSVVQANVDNWVSGSSQRIVYRAGRVLGFEGYQLGGVPDHGPERAAHPLIPDWVGGVYVQRCTGCARLFRV